MKLKRKIRAAIVALIGMRTSVRFTRKGRSIFNWRPKSDSFLLKVLRLMFDVRTKGDGRIYFQLRDRRADWKTVKKLKRHIERLS